jgi:hypothetical protein
VVFRVDVDEDTTPLRGQGQAVSSKLFALVFLVHSFVLCS